MDAVLTSTPYRLKVRLGAHEFEAEGPETAVKEQFSLFLEAVNSAPEPKAANGTTKQIADEVVDSGRDRADNGSASEIDGLWNRAYKIDGDQISLNVLPQTKAQSADSLMLIVYGFQKLLRQESVKATDVTESAKQSGLRIDRLDRSLPNEYSQFIIKGGSGKGTRYRLNNRGLTYAQEMLEGMFE